ncbi:hypothetical protein AB0L49_24410 [Streptomyces antimycoticus]|uniref:hypothetical protein n=1 Tax=Streptomyces antimycoticus TaxID=68175 RepID=UPI003415EF48
MINESKWLEAKSRIPVGVRVSGIVEKRLPFGIFVKLDDFPDVPAVVDAISYLPDDAPVDPEDWPVEGEVLTATVVDHAEHNRQIKLRVGG